MAATLSIPMLEKLKNQRAKIDARIQAAEARSKSAERKQETRRKILVGSYYLDKAREQGKLEELKNRMAEYLSRDSDRKLFDLPPAENPPAKEQKGNA